MTRANEGGMRPCADGRSLLGKTALVTGASSGIGRAIAVTLAGAGATVGVVGRDPSRLADTAAAVKDLGSTAWPLLADLTQPDRIEEVVSKVRREVAGLDILVHSAGLYHRSLMAQAGLVDLDAQYEANLRAPYRLTQSLLPELERAPGDVIFVNSTQGLAASAGVGQFAAFQHALRAVADSLRAELNGVGVRVTSLYVGRTATPRQERVFQAEGIDYTPEILIQPDDVANVVLTAVALPRRAQLPNITIWPTNGHVSARRPHQ